MFRKAERKKARLRLGLVGPSGSGKTYSALLIAKGLGGKVAIVDTENKSADLYASLTDYDVAEMSPPYETEKYIRAIEAAEKAGYNVLILDSISHAWSGEGGLLDRQGKIADSGKGNSYTAWRSVTPLHNKFIDKILSSNLHIIATMRAKTEYVLQTNDRGKQEPKKVGLQPIQREGMDYEFTVVLDLDTNHNCTVSKDRTGLFDGKIFTPGVATGEVLLAWLEEGKEQILMATTEQLKSIATIMKSKGHVGETVLIELSKDLNRKIVSSKEITSDEATDWIETHKNSEAM